jgi:hypothetical protein
MLMFLVVSAIVPPDKEFQRFLSWFVGVLLGINLINNIRLISRIAKKRLLKGNRSKKQSTSRNGMVSFE